MKLGRLAVVAAVMTFQMALDEAPARGENSGDSLSKALSSLTSSLEKDEHEKEIRRAFKAELDRSPSSSEIRRYLNLMEDDHWMEEDVRDDLRGRYDYNRNSRKRIDDPEKIIRRAYQDILNRDPDTDGMRHYRSLMIDKDWTERDVREDLRKSTEKDENSRRQQADKIIRRAYQDVFGRDPDASGLNNYRNKILDQGWDEHDVREALKRSPENRQKNQISRKDAEKIVRRAYLSVLKREPDPGGSKTYVDKVLSDRWAEEDVARELRNSDEYRSKHR
jgi:TorA maturation chaperone TorD